jgi:hypothetical protein
MKSFFGSMAVLAIGALVGCHNDSPPSSPPPPATQPMAVTPTAANTATAQPPVMVKPTMLPDKDMTHTLTADSPYFKGMPAADAKADGTWKAGSKVLLMIPGAKYSKVKSQAGEVGYVPTDNLQPISNK